MIDQKPKKEIQVNIKYRIYLVDDKGMLERPKGSGWQSETDKFDDSETLEGAAQLIEDAGEWREYLILPITSTSIAI